MNIFNKKNLIFDFDGTIADTLDLLVKIYNQICDKYRCLPVDINDKEELKKLKAQEIARRHKVSFLKIPFLAIEVRSRLRKRINDVKIFNGIDLVIKDLKNKGFNLSILTSNSKENVEIFLKNNNLIGAFDFVYSSSNVFGKDRSMRRLLKMNNLNKDECIYIGDETRDVEAMKKVGLPIISVSWGFNSRESLLKVNPDVIVDSPSDLLDFFNNKNI
jgi:phosphoglycolate phosphatase